MLLGRSRVHWLLSARPVGRRWASSEKTPASALDLFDELEGYEQTVQGKDQEQRVAKKASEAGMAKKIVVRDPRIRGSPRRLNMIAALLVGKTYPELKHLLPSLHNTGAREAERAIENGRRRAHEQYNVSDDRRLIVEQAWVGKGEMAPRLRIHGRGKTGIMHRRWGNMTVVMRYISEEDDQLTFERVCEALEKHGIEKHKVRYLIRYGSRSTVYQIGKAAGLTRQQCRSYLKHLSKTHDDFRRQKFVAQAKQ